MRNHPSRPFPKSLNRLRHSKTAGEQFDGICQGCGTAIAVTIDVPRTATLMSQTGHGESPLGATGFLPLADGGGPAPHDWVGPEPVATPFHTDGQTGSVVTELPAGRA